MHAKACHWPDGEEDTLIRGGGGMLAKACHWPNGGEDTHKRRRRHALQGVPLAKRGVGSSTRCHMLGSKCPEAVLRDKVLYLPTFSHLLIGNKLRGREGRGKRERARARERERSIERPKLPPPLYRLP
jgi:hypothetical protein